MKNLNLFYKLSAHGSVFDRAGFPFHDENIVTYSLTKLYFSDKLGSNYSYVHKSHYT